MDRADKAVLRLAIGLGLAVLVAYGLALPAPFVVCVMAVLMLCKPGPPIPLFKGMVIAVVVAAWLLAGVLMVPLLEHYALAGVLLTGALLYGVFFSGARSANPLTDDPGDRHRADSGGRRGRAGALAALSVTLAVGILIGVLVSGASHALFPDPPPAAQAASSRVRTVAEAARWIALRARWSSCRCSCWR